MQRNEPALSQFAEALRQVQPKNDGVAPIREVDVRDPNGRHEVHITLYVDPLMMDLLGESDKWLADHIQKDINVGKAETMLGILDLLEKAKTDEAAKQQLQALAPFIKAVQDTAHHTYHVKVIRKDGMPLNNPPPRRRGFGR